MKNNDTNESPLMESASNRDNPCFDTAPDIATLNVITGQGESFQLPYAQFLYSELGANPALEEDAQAPPQRLVVRFAMAEVMVLGSGLQSIEGAIQKHTLKFVQPAGGRYVATLKTHVASVSIALAKEAV